MVHVARPDSERMSKPSAFSDMKNDLARPKFFGSASSRSSLRSAEPSRTARQAAALGSANSRPTKVQNARSSRTISEASSESQETLRGKISNTISSNSDASIVA